MKKVLAIVMLAVLGVFTLAGCGSTADVKTGLGTVISIAKSASATADAAGKAQADVVMAAVTVDKDGKILKVTIDTAQVAIPFDATGAITADLAKEYMTKVELGDDYGMKKASTIGKEWYEEIAALEAWMVGKTIEQVKAIGVNADGEVTEADLISSVTVSVGDYIKAVEKAVTNAK